jgi:hypothetical protein
VIFDDIQWSAGMREAWSQIMAMEIFSDCLDIGELGVCSFTRNNQTPKRNWDLKELV